MAFDAADKDILIVGAGCFGLSTAYHLLQRHPKSVTVIDKAADLPAADAASTDINKVIRSTYPDVFYTRLARRAIAEWKRTEEWGDTYRECGVVCVRQLELEGPGVYMDQGHLNDIAEGARAEDLTNLAAIRSAFPPGVRLSLSDAAHGSISRDGGWALAAQGVARMMEKVRALGGTIVPGKAAAELVKRDGRTAGVRCADGTVYEADLVVLAVGSWTATAFPELDLGTRCLPSGQCVATIQLTPEEGEIYRRCPVYRDFDSGFYIFPANDDNIVKFSIHTGGYIIPGTGPSVPRTILSHPEDGSRIPKAALQALRHNLGRIYPDLADKPFAGTRMCWYTDSPDEDWVIGYHPTDPTLVLATAGSGHAYKFLPVIGELVADAIEGKLAPELTQKFAVDRAHLYNVYDSGVRARPLALVLDELCVPADLLPAPVVDA